MLAEAVWALLFFVHFLPWLYTTCVVRTEAFIKNHVVKLLPALPLLVVVPGDGKLLEGSDPLGLAQRKH